MDATRFDRLARSLITLADRRVVARGFLSLIPIPVSAVVAARLDAAARKNKKKKNKNKKKKKNKKNRCQPDCTGKACGPDGCGGNCGECGADEVCLAGECARFCHVCASGCLFNSIPSALAAAGFGGTVILCPETFTGTVNILSDVAIVGAGADATETVLDGGGNGPVLVVQQGRTVTVRNLTITGVQSDTQGAIANQGTLTLEAVRVVDNDAADFGGIFNFAGATLTLTDSLVQGNTSGVLGGGIRNSTGVATLVRTEVEGNAAPRGGGISNDLGGTVNLTDNSQVTGNTATGEAGQFGGGVFNEGTVTLSGGSTIEDNEPDDCVDVGAAAGCP